MCKIKGDIMKKLLLMPVLLGALSLNAGYKVLVHNGTDGKVDVTISQATNIYTGDIRVLNIPAGGDARAETELLWCINKITAYGKSGSIQGQRVVKSTGSNICRNLEVWITYKGPAPVGGGQQAGGTNVQQTNISFGQQQQAEMGIEIATLYE